MKGNKFLGLKWGRLCCVLEIMYNGLDFIKEKIGNIKGFKYLSKMIIF